MTSKANQIHRIYCYIPLQIDTADESDVSLTVSNNDSVDKRGKRKGIHEVENEGQASNTAKI